MTFQFLFFFFIPCGRLEILIHRSWIDFGRNTVRGRSVRRRPSLLAWHTCSLPSTKPACAHVPTRLRHNAAKGARGGQVVRPGRRPLPPSPSLSLRLLGRRHDYNLDQMEIVVARKHENEEHGQQCGTASRGARSTIGSGSGSKSSHCAPVPLRLPQAVAVVGCW